MLHEVVLMLLFIKGQTLVGAQLVGSAPSVIECHQNAAAMIAAHEAQGDNLPDGVHTLPVCINTEPFLHAMPEHETPTPAPHDDSTRL